tara:strand:- start:191 stop:688 length:498 start_codon:yes stop_codon:yes gene_type:complete
MKQWNQNKYWNSEKADYKISTKIIHSAVNAPCKDKYDNNSFMECNKSKKQFICRLCYNEVIPVNCNNGYRKGKTVSTEEYDKTEKYLWINKDSILDEFVTIPNEFNLDIKRHIVHRQKLVNKLYFKISSLRRIRRKSKNSNSYYCVNSKTSEEKYNSMHLHGYKI